MSKTTFVNGNPSLGIAGTVITAEIMDALNRKHKTGRDIDGEGPLEYAADTGAANAYAAALAPALDAYIVGLPIWFLASAANTGASTLNVNGLGVKTIKKRGAQDLLAGDILAGQIVGLVYDGTNFQMLTRAMSEDCRPGDLILSTLNTSPAGALKINGASLSRGAYAALFANAVPQMSVTISLASPGVLATGAAHGLVVGDKVRLATTGALPTGLATGTDYFIVSVPLTTTFTVSATLGGAAINTSGSQSGVHTLTVWRGYGPGDGATTFTLPNALGYGLRIYDDGAGVDTGRTLGSQQGDTLQGHYHNLPACLVTPLYSQGNVGGSPSNSGTVQNSTTLSPVTDGVNGTPRISGETRMKNFAIQAYIKY